MEWSKAKSWLIVLFLCINLFLVAHVVNIHMQTAYIDEDTIAQTIEVLQKNAVTIDKNLIPAKIPKISTLEVSNALGDTGELANKVLGNQYTMSSSGKIFTKSGKRLSVSGDMIFYINGNPKEILSNLTEQNAAETVKQRFEDYGFDMKNALFSVTAGDERAYQVLAEQTVNRRIVFDAAFKAAVSSNGLLSFEGSWFVPQEKKTVFNGGSKRARLVTGVLIDFLSDPLRPKGTPAVITGLSLGYLTGEKDTFHKSVMAVPTWRVTTDDGRSYYYDARQQ